MGTFTNDTSIDGDAYIQRLSTYIRRNEEALANGLLCFSKNRSTSVKPIRLTFTIHHLYYITERIESSPLGVDVGPLNVKVDNPNHEPTFISFMANNARSSKHFDSDARSISSINSMKSIISSASVYWRSATLNKDPKSINKDIKYLYSSFTKIPCLILTPKTKVGSISSYEEFPCDTSVPLKMFKNLQVLELVDYEPNEIFGWHILSEQLRILIIRNSKISNIAEVLFNFVIDDESGRSSFNSHKQQARKFNDDFDPSEDYNFTGNSAFRYPKRDRATTLSGAGSLPKEILLNEYSSHLHISQHYSSHSHSGVHLPTSSMPISSHSDHSKFGSSEHTKLASSELSKSTPGSSDNSPPNGSKDYQSLPENKWCLLKQLTVTDTSITSIPGFIFKPMSNLVKLNLSNNLLEELPMGLEQLVNVKFINFSDNYITNLRSLPKNLKNLTTLNLNNNKLTDLNGLEHLCNLEKIDLRRNQLADLKSLKPIVLQFIKNPIRFSNVYLANNKLPKNYRIDLFNLINGVKYKNNMKLDDSKPGYFEGALLLDAESAFKNLENFFSEVSKQSSSASSPVPTNAHVEEINLYDEIINNPKFPISPPTSVSSESSQNPVTSIPPSASSNSVSTIVPKTTQRSLGHRRAHTLEALMEPFSVIKVTTTDSSPTETGNGTSTPRKKFDLSHTVLTTSPLSIHPEPNSIISSPSSKNPSSPLSSHQNFSSKFDNVSYTSKGTLLSIHMNNSNGSMSPSSVSALKKSSTMTQLELEPSAASSPSTAPNILTPLQVTARMST